MTAAQPLPTDLDLWAIHRAFLDAGFTQQRTETAESDPNWVYLRPGDDFDFIALPNPNLGLGGDGMFYTPALQRKVAVQALDALCAHTGEFHLACGPRNDREKALIEALNTTHHAA